MAKEEAACRALLVHSTQLFPLREIDPGARQFYADIGRLERALNASGLMPNASPWELRKVYLESIGAHTASYLPRLQPRFGGDDSRDGRELFWGFPLEQLFFYLHCFSQCGSKGRTLQAKIAVCNVALPAVTRFRRAFKCGPQHRLITDFTWPEIPEASTVPPS